MATLSVFSGGFVGEMMRFLRGHDESRVATAVLYVLFQGCSRPAKMVPATLCVPSPPGQLGTYGLLSLPHPPEEPNLGEPPPRARTLGGSRSGLWLTKVYQPGLHHPRSQSKMTIKSPHSCLLEGGGLLEAPPSPGP